MKITKNNLVKLVNEEIRRSLLTEQSKIPRDAVRNLIASYRKTKDSKLIDQVRALMAPHAKGGTEYVPENDNFIGAIEDALSSASGSQVLLSSISSTQQSAAVKPEEISTQSEEKIYTFHGDTWTYKIKNDMWYTHKKEWDDSKWVSLAADKFEGTRKKLDDKYPDAREKSTKTTNIKDTIIDELLNPPGFNGNERFKEAYNDILKRLSKPDKGIISQAHKDVAEQLFLKIISLVKQNVSKDELIKNLTRLGLAPGEQDGIITGLKFVLSESKDNSIVLDRWQRIAGLN